MSIAWLRDENRRFIPFFKGGTGAKPHPQSAWRDADTLANLNRMITVYVEVEA
jgi:hypothetical protein